MTRSSSIKPQPTTKSKGKLKNQTPKKTKPTTIKNTKYPCKICSKSVHKNHRALQCDVCDFWVHIKCNKLYPGDYEKLKLSSEPWYCLHCLKTNLPFMNETNDQLYLTTTKGLNIELQDINIEFTRKHEDFFKQIANLTNPNSENRDTDDNISNICEYYDIEKFCEAKFKSENYFSTLHLNIASLQYHIDDLKNLLLLLDYNFDIITITETKIVKGTEPNIDIEIPNYDIHSTPTESSKGGTLIYISNKHSDNCIPRTDLQIYKSRLLESTFIEILEPKQTNTIVGCIYKHPCMSEKEFNDDFLTPLTQKLSKENKKVYLTGDFNIDLLKINTNEAVDEYLDTLTSNHLMPLITLPTRVTSKSKTLIDNIFYNQYTPDIISGNLTVGISDHMPQFSLIPQRKQHHLPKKHNIYKRNFKNFDRENFILDLLEVDWTEASTNTDVNKSLEHLLNKIEVLLDKYAPLTKMTNKEFKLKLKPWLTKGILKSIKIQHKTFGKFIKSKNPIVKEQLQTLYKQYRNSIVNLTRISKKNYYDNYFSKNSQNMKKLWAGINEIVNLRPKTTSAPNCIVNNGITLTDPENIANSFNNYFSNVAKNILDKRKFEGNKHFSHYLKNSNINSFFIKRTDEAEISMLINKLDINKSNGPNSIPNGLFKLIKDIVSKPLSDIFNTSIATGTHPDKLKTSQVIPILKKGSKLLTSNYRPISLLSNINKIFEKLMFSRLIYFLDSFKCIYERQFGFRERHSTNHALISITEKIREALDNDNFACGIFVDLQKAFDTVNHEILLKKLEHYGIRGISNDWFRSYLHNRKQFVSINGFESSNKVIEHGVPQGSVLGPLLFLIYINDLHNSIKHSEVFHFADDTNLLHISKNTPNRMARKINSDLKSLRHWLLANKISLNAGKTELIIFKNAKKQIPNNIKIKICGKQLPLCKQIKYLGIYIDENLSWKYHIDQLATKLKRANNLLAIARHYVPSPSLLSIYHGSFSSHLSYGCQIWGQSPNNYSKLVTIQKKALRIMNFSTNQEHTGPIFKKMNLLRISDTILLGNIVLTHKVLNAKIPDNLLKFLTLRNDCHDHYTKTSSIGSVSLPTVHRNTGRNSIRYQCAITWNSMIKDLHSQKIDYVTKYKNIDNDDKQWVQHLKINSLKQIITKYILSTY